MKDDQLTTEQRLRIVERKSVSVPSCTTPVGLSRLISGSSSAGWQGRLKLPSVRRVHGYVGGPVKVVRHDNVGI